ncbi:MAG TPA: NAD(P)H-binding protein, partial [Fimbriimonas sp.]
MKVLVTGGTGLVGEETVRRLLDKGIEVRLLTRNAERDAAKLGPGCEPSQGSVQHQKDVEGAAEGCEAVLHIAGIVREEPPDHTFAAVNVGGTRHLLDEAERAGVRRFLYVSSLGADTGTSDYHRSKLDAENLVRTFSRDWLICRPGGVYGPGDETISVLLGM